VFAKSYSIGQTKTKDGGKLMSATAQDVGQMPGGESRPMSKEERKVILASSLGTAFEWYDFYLFGSLAAIIGRQFFAPLPPTGQFIMTLLGFAAGFFVRPFGALVFGRLGDLLGRKYTFLITIVIMGISTLAVGLLPGYATLGIAAPVILIAFRLLQGLALGGEYGGAATYVAEHAPPGKRGFYTSFIQITATFGLFLSLIVIVVTRTQMGEAAFADWGWRIPFWISAVLLAISVWIRLSLNESPAFLKIKAEGKHSTQPLTDSFAKWQNLKIVILALVGLTMGEAVVWYAGQFYSLFFLTQTLKVDPVTANYLIAGALLLGCPFFVVFGWLSDKIGRKPIIMAACLLAVLTYFPLYKGVAMNANPALYAAQQKSPLVVEADPGNCSLQLKLTGTETYTNSCDIATSALANLSVNYSKQDLPAGSVAQVKVGDKAIESYDPKTLKPDEAKAKAAAFTASVAAAVKDAGYPAKADPAQMNTGMTLLLLWILVIYVTMVYGPIAAMLVEMFPTRIRYSSLSLPYHIGNGWFGGFLPPTVFAIVAATGDIYAGLWYPIIIAAITFVVGTLFIKETRNVDIHDPNLAHAPINV
jgi:MFS family permease